MYMTLLHLEGREGSCCLTMDSVEEVRKIETGLLREPPPSLNSELKKFCQAIFLDDGYGMIMLLSFDKIFESLLKKKER